MRARGALVVLSLLLLAACGDDRDAAADADEITTTIPDAECECGALLAPGAGG